MLPEDPRSRYEPSDIESVEVTLLEHTKMGPGELNDVLTGAAHLGLRRARLRGTSPGHDDLAFALSIFTWWPFKPRPALVVEAQLVRGREPLFAGLGETFKFEMLDSVVPDETLAVTPDELYRRQQVSVQSFLHI